MIKISLSQLKEMKTSHNTNGLIEIFRSNDLDIIRESSDIWELDGIRNKSGLISEFRRLSGDYLGELADPTTVPAIIEILKVEGEKWDGNPIRNFSANAAKVLVKIGEPSLEPLLELLKDENRRISELSAKALGEIGGPKVVPALIDVMENKTLYVRRYAALILGDIGDERALHLLEEATNDSNMYVKNNATKALRKLKSRLNIK